jgi:predicted transcriptional regulator
MAYALLACVPYRAPLLFALSSAVRFFTQCVFLRTLLLIFRRANDNLHIMPTRSTPPMLSRRERQVMDILYNKKQATAAQVLESMPDPPGYSAVRTLLTTLENKGYVKHTRDGAKFVYVPVVQHRNASRSAIAHLIHTFFGGSRGRAAAALLDVAPSQFTEEELDELDQLIKKARKGEKK